jgi:hypothetical protein
MLPARRFFAIISYVFALCAAAAAQTTGHVRGTVTDESGGVLPGVTVTVSAPDGQPLAVLATDAAGEYDAQVPAGRVRVAFSLEGFAPATDDASIDDRRATTLSVRLAVAPQSETVDVRAEAPVARQRSVPMLPPPVVPAHDRDSICGPSKLGAAPESLGLVAARRNEGGAQLFAADDQLLIEGGTRTGLAVGTNVVARRTYRVSGNADGLTAEHTAGVLQIVAATEESALAVVVYACDEIRRGDRLAPFAPEPLRAPESFGVPAFDNAARILFGDSGQLIGAPRRLMVIDRGRADAVHAGQRMTVFRKGKGRHAAAVTIGDAVVVAVRDDSATIRIEHATDIIEPGDWAAPQRSGE